MSYIKANRAEIERIKGDSDTLYNDIGTVIDGLNSFVEAARSTSETWKTNEAAIENYWLKPEKSTYTTDGKLDEARYNEALQGSKERAIRDLAAAVTAYQSLLNGVSEITTSDIWEAKLNVMKGKGALERALIFINEFESLHFKDGVLVPEELGKGYSLDTIKVTGADGKVTEQEVLVYTDENGNKYTLSEMINSFYTYTGITSSSAVALASSGLSDEVLFGKDGQSGALNKLVAATGSAVDAQLQKGFYSVASADAINAMYKDAGMEEKFPNAEITENYNSALTSFFKDKFSDKDIDVNEVASSLGSDTNSKALGGMAMAGLLMAGLGYTTSNSSTPNPTSAVGSGSSGVQTGGTTVGSSGGSGGGSGSSGSYGTSAGGSSGSSGGSSGASGGGVSSGGSSGSSGGSTSTSGGAATGGNTSTSTGSTTGGTTGKDPEKDSDSQKPTDEKDPEKDTEKDQDKDKDKDTEKDPEKDKDTEKDPEKDENLNIDTDKDGKADLNIDTDNDGKADLNIDTNDDGKANLNVDTDGDNKADLNVDTDNDGKADLNLDTNGDGKANLNVDTTGDNKADLNVDSDNDGKADLNIDTTGDGKANLNVDTDGDNKADVNLDTTGNGQADLNIDTDGDNKADINIDTSGDGKADTNLDINNDNKADLNIDTDGDNKADLNIDTTGDNKANVNIDSDGDNKADLNIDTDGDNKADLNIDTTGDNKANLNVDTDGDNKADLNIDTNNDGIADTNIDTNGDGQADTNIDPSRQPESATKYITPEEASGITEKMGDVEKTEPLEEIKSTQLTSEDIDAMARDQYYSNSQDIIDKRATNIDTYNSMTLDDKVVALENLGYEHETAVTLANDRANGETAYLMGMEEKELTALSNEIATSSGLGELEHDTVFDNGHNIEYISSGEANVDMTILPKEVLDARSELNTAHTNYEEALTNANKAIQESNQARQDYFDTLEGINKTSGSDPTKWTSEQAESYNAALTNYNNKVSDANEAVITYNTQKGLYDQEKLEYAQAYDTYRKNAAGSVSSGTGDSGTPNDGSNAVEPPTTFEEEYPDLTDDGMII